MGKEIRLLFWGWLAGDGGGEDLTLGEEVETGAGGIERTADQPKAG